MSQNPFNNLKRECLTILAGQNIDESKIELTIPPRRQFGDLSSNIAFLLSEESTKPPRVIAQEILQEFDPGNTQFIQKAEVAGAGYINFFLDYGKFTPYVINVIQEMNEEYGVPDTMTRSNVIIEHTSVNPNKPWHIGHSRNAVFGDVLGRLFRKVGHNVEIQNYIDDTGKQVADTIFALEYYGEQIPSDVKFDHFLGELYVRLHNTIGQEDTLKSYLESLEASVKSGNQKLKKERDETRQKVKEIAQINKGIERVMHDLEAGKYRGLVEKCLNAQLETAWNLGIVYGLLCWESDIVRAQLLDEAMEKIKESKYVYTPDKGPHKGCLVMDMRDFLPGESVDDEHEEEHPSTKVLIRSNGIPTYVAKDIAYQMWKFGLLDNDMLYTDYQIQPNGVMLSTTHPQGQKRIRAKVDQVINDIGAEQTYTQTVVYTGLKVAGYEKEFENSHHLAYGHVKLPTERMSGRAGTGIPTDDVLVETVQEAYERVKEKRGHELTESEMSQISQAVGIGAIRYFMCQYNPHKEITFDLKTIVSFDGNSGLYLQYSYVRTVSLLNKASEEKGILIEYLKQAEISILDSEHENNLIFCLSRFPIAIELATKTLNTSVLTDYVYELATLFNQFYGKCPVLNAPEPMMKARLLLVDTVNKVMRNSFNILGIPLLEKM